MKLYFVRHGKTTFNQIGKLQGGQIDSPLVPAGIKGAKELGARLADVHFEKVYVSPLQRAKKTALYIMQANEHQLQSKIIEEKDFRELDFGHWEGRDINEIKHQAEFFNLQTKPADYNPSAFAGEIYEMLVYRSRVALQRMIVKNSKAENLLIVSHGITLTTLINSLEEKEIAACRENGLVNNTFLSIVKTVDDGRHFELLLYNG